MLGMAGIAKVDAARHSTQTPPGTGPDAAFRVQRLSWAGVRLELPELTIFIDPWVSTGIWEHGWTGIVVPIEATAARRVALVTHAHNDHFDPAALRAALGDRGTVICHEDVADFVGSRGFRVRAVRTWEPLMLGDVTITAVPAADGFADPQVSWVVASNGRRLLHGGDTQWHGAWWQIARLGRFDAALLPINGARFPARLPASEVPATLTPEQAVAAGVVLGATVLVPMHYGMNDPASYLETPHAEAAFVAEARRRRISTQVLQPGGWLEWPASLRE